MKYIAIFIQLIVKNGFIVPLDGFSLEIKIRENPKGLSKNLKLILIRLEFVWWLKATTQKLKNMH